MTDRYPILVREFKGMQSLTIVCETCHAEEVISPDDILNEGLYACPAGITACGGTAVMKYEQADPCPGCAKLGFWSERLGFCCSRVCQLQSEYAAALEGSR